MTVGELRKALARKSDDAEVSFVSSDIKFRSALVLASGPQSSEAYIVISLDEPKPRTKH